jgi:cobalt-zinc-cadmium efflux system outer membrane protein
VKSGTSRKKGNRRRRLAASHAALPRVGTALAIFAGGCQSYEPMPLDGDAHRVAWLARTPESAEVAALAEQLGAASATTTTPFELSDGVSLPEAEAVALVYNAELRIARAKAGVTKALAENAGLWSDPTLGVDLTRIIQSVENPWKVFTTIGFTVPISGRLEVEKARAGAVDLAQLQRVAESEWQVRIALREAWIEWSAIAAHVDTTRAFVGRLEQVLEIVDAMDRSGELSRLEVRLFRVERATRASELRVVEARLLESELAVKHLMGLAPTAPMQLQPWLQAGATPQASGAAIADGGPDLLERLAEANPSLAVSRAEYEVAEQSLALEIRRQYPDLQLAPGYGREDGNDEVLLGLSLPIPVLNANRQAIAEARAQRDVARAENEATFERLAGQLASAIIRHDAALVEREAYEREIVPLVDAQYADARKVAELGEIDTFVLLETLTQQQQAKLRLIEARRNEAMAALRIVDLLGPALISASTTAPPNTSLIDDSGVHP